MTILIDQSLSQYQQLINNIDLGRGEREQIIIIADVSLAVADSGFEPIGGYF